MLTGRRLADTFRRVALQRRLKSGRVTSNRQESGVEQNLTDERELVRRMLAGDERAFGAFFDGYFPRVYRFALPRLGGDADASKDVVQATLVKAIRNLASFRGDAALFSWICQICRRPDNRSTCVPIADVPKHVVLLEDTPQMRAVLESIEAPQKTNRAAVRQ